MATFGMIQFWEKLVVGKALLTAFGLLNLENRFGKSHADALQLSSALLDVGGGGGVISKITKNCRRLRTSTGMCEL